MRFDAYAGSLREVQLEHAAEALSWSLKGLVCKGPKLRRYGDTLAIDVCGRTAVWLGRDEGNDSIFFEGKGETSPTLARGVRVHFPGHTVARADVCEDYDHEGAFDELQRIVRVHKGPKVQAGYVALPDDVEKGKTWAAGIRGGKAMVRVYEAGKHPDRLHLCRPNLARIEGEFRPHYAADKLAAASFSPLDFWGMAGWTHRVGEALAQVEIPRYEEEPRTQSFDRTTAYLARTYQRHWRQLLADHGDWECVGRELQAVWAADAEVAEKLRRFRQGQ